MILIFGLIGLVFFGGGIYQLVAHGLVYDAPTMLALFATAFGYLLIGFTIYCSMCLFASGPRGRIINPQGDFTGGVYWACLWLPTIVIFCVPRLNSRLYSALEQLDRRIAE